MQFFAPAGMTTVTMWCRAALQKSSRHCYKPLRFSMVGLSREACLTIETWLILPVVICLSQRLSHACLSINKFVLWNCEWLIKSVIVYLIIPYYLDNRGNSSANTCFKPRLLEGVYLLDKKPIVAIRFLVNHDNYSNRMALPAMVHSNFCPINFRW